MKKLIVSLLLTTSVAFGVSIDDAGYNNLTAEQQAQVVQTVAQMNAQKVEPEKTTVETAKEWVSIGTEVGKGLAGAAKEMGVAVNDFAKTDVGVIVTWLVVWNYMGEDLLPVFLHIASGILIWVIGGIISTVYYYRVRTFDVVITNKEKGKFTRTYTPLTADDKAWLMVVVSVSFLLGFFTIITW